MDPTPTPAAASASAVPADHPNAPAAGPAAGSVDGPVAAPSLAPGGETFGAGSAAGPAPPAPPAKPPRRRWPWILAMVIVIPTIALAGLLAWMTQTETGRRWLSAALEQALSTPQGRVRLTGLSFPRALDVHLDGLTVADGARVWLQGEALVFSWSPRGLLAGEVVVHRLSAAWLRLDAPPDGASDSAQPPSPARDGEEMGWTPPARIERLAVDRMTLGEGVLGQEGSWRVQGEAGVTGEGDLWSRIEMTGLEGTGGRLALEWARDAAGLTLDVAIAESDGPLARYLELGDPGPLHLMLNGSGPSAQWRGRLDLLLPGLGQLQGELTAAAHGEGLAADLAGDWDLPEMLQETLGNRLAARLEARWDGEAGLMLRRLDLAGPTGELAAHGSFDFAAETIHLSGEATLPDLAALVGGAAGEGEGIHGRGRLPFRIEGALADPGYHLQPALADLALGANAVDRLEGEVDILPTVNGWRVGGTGSAQGVRIVGDFQPPPGEWLWNLAWEPDDAGGGGALSAALTHPGARLTAHGGLDAAGNPAPGEASVEIADLALWLGSLTPGVKGRAALTATWRFPDRAAPHPPGRLEADLDLSLADFALGDPAAAALLGRTPRLTARLNLSDAEHLTVEKIRLRGAAIAAEGRVGLAGRRLSGKVTARAANLARLSRALGTPLAGAASASLTLAGTIDAPGLTFDAAVDGPLMADSGLTGLTATGQAQMGGAPPGTGPAGTLGTGRLALTARSGTTPEEPAVLTVPWRLDAERLRLEGLDLSAPFGAVTGQLDLETATGLIAGSLQGEITDLRAMGFWIQAGAAAPPLQGGTGNARLALSRSQAGQAVEWAASVRDLVLEGAAIGGVDLSGSAQLGPDLDWRARLTLQNAQIGPWESGQRFAAAALSANGGAHRAAVDLTLEGEVSGPLSLTAHAAVEHRPETGALQVLLASATGRWRDLPLALDAPALFVMTPETLTLEPLQLTWGMAQAAVQADLDARGGMLTAELALPLIQASVAEIAGGELSGRLEIRGGVNDPTATLTATMSDLRLTDAPDLPPVSMEAEGRLGEGQFAGQGILSGLMPTPLDLTAAAPVALHWSHQPAARIDWDQAAAQMTGVMDLERAAVLAGLDGHRLAGDAEADIALNGPLEAPVLAGSLTLADGVYENGLLGTLFQAINARLAAQPGEPLELILDATDGGDGRITVRARQDGTDSLAGLRAQIVLADAAVARRDDFQARLAGELALSRSGGGFLIEGALTGRGITLYLPESAPTSIPSLEVREAWEAPAAGHAPAPTGGGRTQAPGVSVPPAVPSGPTALNLRLHLPDRVFVMGKGLDSEWTGDLAVSGSVAQPRITGMLTVKRGAFQLMDHQFRLENSTIRFTGASPPRPELDLNGVVRKEGLTAIVRLTGPLDALALKLESQPPMPEDEILARLLFGREADNITPGQALKVAMLLRQLRSGGIDMLGRARRALGVDRLDWSGDNASSGRLRAGKYVGDNLYIEAAQGLDVDSGQVRVELEVEPPFGLTTTLDRDAGAYFGLHWRREY